MCLILKSKDNSDEIQDWELAMTVNRRHCERSAAIFKEAQEH